MFDDVNIGNIGFLIASSHLRPFLSLQMRLRISVPCFCFSFFVFVFFGFFFVQFFVVAKMIKSDGNGKWISNDTQNAARTRHFHAG